MITADRTTRIALIVLATLAGVAALRAGGEILAPIALALTMGIVLSPVSDTWERLMLPRVPAALLSLCIALLAILAASAVLYPLVDRLVGMAPKVWADMQELVRAMRGVAESVETLNEDISEQIAPKAHAAPAAERTAPDVPLPSVSDALFLAPAIAAQILVFAGTLFFFLLSRSEILDWIARAVAKEGEAAAMARQLARAERRVARYFLTISLINASLGALTAGCLYLLGMPGALLFGLVAGLANFILYLGPALVVVMLGFAGVAAFDGLAALAPAAGFAALNLLEGQFVTPALVGQRLSVNPLLVFLAIVFGVWLWGPVGGVVAIPLLLMAQAVAEDRPAPGPAPAG